MIPMTHTPDQPGSEDDYDPRDEEYRAHSGGAAFAIFLIFAVVCYAMNGGHL